MAPVRFCVYPPLRPQARKGDRGRLLVVGGGPYYGAPVLAAQAAGRSGCDLIHLAVPQPQNQAAWPLYLIPEFLPAVESFFDSVCFEVLAQRCQELHFDAVLLGPGLGRNPKTIDAIWKLLLFLIEQDMPLVVDADALYVLAQNSPGSWPKNGLKAMRGIITPHRGECQRWLDSKSPSEILEALDIPSCENIYKQEEYVVLCSGSTDEISGAGGRLLCPVAVTRVWPVRVPEICWLGFVLRFWLRV